MLSPLYRAAVMTIAQMTLTLTLPASALAQQAAAPPAAVPASAAPAATPAAPQIQLEVLRAGTGPMPADSDVAVINYEGRLRDGTMFDSNPRAPLPVDAVIPGFSEGLKRMQKGGRYRLTIPAALAYGDRALPSIPANSDLIFTVELLDFGPASTERAMMGLPTVTVVASHAGSGRMAADGDIALITYHGRMASGTEFDGGQAVPVTVGQLMPGMNDALKQMQAGGHYMVTIPAGLGFGDRAVGPVPANSELHYEVELIAVRSLAEIGVMMQAAAAPASATPVTAHH